VEDKSAEFELTRAEGSGMRPRAVRAPCLLLLALIILIRRRITQSKQSVLESGIEVGSRERCHDVTFGDQVSCSGGLGLSGIRLLSLLESIGKGLYTFSDTVRFGRSGEERAE
jgi:hypothetical protein